MTFTETAYAKINLALHVRERRDDGYHALETLFAFVDAGDTLSAKVADQDSLQTFGPFAGNIDNPLDNLVAKALNAIPRPQGLAVTLEKNLPVAAGLGGGSADAGAVFRLVERLHGLPDDWRARAAKLGADVPACVASDIHIGTGIGEERRELENDLAGTPVLLVNPRVPLSTGPVFKAWDQVDRGPLPTGSTRTIALEGRNDLEPPALSLCPVIGDGLDALRGTEAWLIRMSGSGATCFALFDTVEQCAAAKSQIASDHPEWWMLGGKLR
ncbi:MAG: 4-(cytidine 5'-diphospho)-2-C-methyl-D-erythritol kinase [Pseudomonadota bacterium]